MFTDVGVDRRNLNSREGFFWDGLTRVESPGEVLVHELVEIHVNLPSSRNH
jgi:hypothetical protein